MGTEKMHPLWAKQFATIPSDAQINAVIFAQPDLATARTNIGNHQLESDYNQTLQWQLLLGLLIMGVSAEVLGDFPGVQAQLSVSQINTLLGHDTIAAINPIGIVEPEQTQ